MKEIFGEYGLLITDFIGASVGLAIFFRLFIGANSMVSSVISNLLECLI